MSTTPRSERPPVGRLTPWKPSEWLGRREGTHGCPPAAGQPRSMDPGCVQSVPVSHFTHVQLCFVAGSLPNNPSAEAGSVRLLWSIALGLGLPLGQCSLQAWHFCQLGWLPVPCCPIIVWALPGHISGPFSLPLAIVSVGGSPLNALQPVDNAIVKLRQRVAPTGLLHLSPDWELFLCMQVPGPIKAAKGAVPGVASAHEEHRHASIQQTFEGS